MAEFSNVRAPLAQSSDTLVLVNRNMVAVPSLGWMILIVLAPVLLVGGTLLSIIVGAKQHAGEAWLDAFTRLLAKVHWQDVVAAILPHGGVTALQLIMLLGALLAMERTRRLERLVLSPEGIRYVSPFPRLLKRVAPSWFLAWHEIQAIELSLPQFAKSHLAQSHLAQSHLAQSHLAQSQHRYGGPLVLMWFIGPDGKQRTVPTIWVDPAHYTWRDHFREAFKRRRVRAPAVDIKTAISASALGRYLAAHQPQLEINWTPTVNQTMTSLEKNPHGIAAMVLLALLFLYSLVDYVMGPESYIDDPMNLVYIYVTGGMVFAMLSALWLARSTLQTAEKAGLALLLGIVAGFAMVPGALRINQFVGNHPLVSYNYHVVHKGDDIVLQPVTPGVPTIDHYLNAKYWQQFGKDDLYPVQVRHGILGFYQFNSAPIDARVRGK